MAGYLRNCHTATNLLKLFAKTETADVTFVFAGVASDHQQIPAHRCLLAVASPVFMRMFFGELREIGNVNIVDCTYEAFLEFLRFFYADKIELTLENISEVMVMADKYDVAGLMNLCGIYLERLLDVDSVCWVYDLALMFQLKHLVRLCEEKISMETTAVLASEGFRKSTHMVLSKILEMDALSCDEIVVYTRAMEWARDSCVRMNVEPTMVNRKTELGLAFEQIRFPTMSSQDFTNCIEEPGLLEAAEFMDILMYMTLKRTMQKSRFSLSPRSGRPAWTKDQHIKFCDRRSLPNLNLSMAQSRDVVVFSVNERIILGQLSFSTFKSELNDNKTGTLTIRKGGDELLQQKVDISTTSYTKILLEMPIVVKPFEDYVIETYFELDPTEELVYRTECRSTIALDGGIRFQFKPEDGADYDNVAIGMIPKLYFKSY